MTDATRGCCWFLGLSFGLVIGCSDDGARWNPVDGEPADTIAPARIEDFRATPVGVSGVKLTWTAVGDDGTTGRATAYDLRWARSPLSDANWEDGIFVLGMPSRPAPAGSAEEYGSQGLGAGDTLYYAIRALDEAGNASPVSPCVSITTPPAGPNRGGVLILHAATHLVYSGDGTDWNGQSGLRACGSAVTRLAAAEDSAGGVWFVLAAFGDHSSPRLKAVDFGLEYDESKIEIGDFGACGSDPFWIASNTWPRSGSGIAVSFTIPQTQLVSEVCWLSGTARGPAVLRLVPHPDAEGNESTFADDAIPLAVDPVSAYGALGFGREGSLTCP